MNNETAIWNKLKGSVPYCVNVRHNFWGGKYYESSCRAITVVAGSANQAEYIAKNNLEAVEKHFRAMRIQRGSRTVRAIRKCERYRLQPIDIRRVTKLYSTGTVKALTSDGEMVMHDFDTRGDA